MNKTVRLLLPLLLLSTLAHAQAVAPPPMPRPPALPRPPSPPGPPSFRPAGPDHGAPGRVGPSLPPSPNRVHVPGTVREHERPGVYQQKPAQASHRPPGMPVDEYRTKRDVRDVYKPSGCTDAAWNKCWRDAQLGLNESKGTYALGLDSYECLRNRLLDACGEVVVRRGMQGDRGIARTPQEKQVFDLISFIGDRTRLTHLLCMGSEVDRTEVDRLFGLIVRKQYDRWKTSAVLPADAN